MLELTIYLCLQLEISLTKKKSDSNFGHNPKALYYDYQQMKILHFLVFPTFHATGAYLKMIIN